MECFANQFYCTVSPIDMFPIWNDAQRKQPDMQNMDN